ncbi:MAG: hypothetical protein RBR67_09200 [Desulfobacterium sp.]|nr:hypothetical protein [Desulfobacterium sp.]
MTPEHIAVQKWLKEKDTIPFLQKIADRSLREIQSKGLAPMLFFDCHTNDKKDRVDELLSRLFIFISDTNRVHQLICRKGQFMVPELRRAFINSIIDEARTKDPYKKLYRNAQAAIRESTLFSSPSSTAKADPTKADPTKAISPKIFCFWKKHAVSPGSVFLTDDDLKEIPFPDTICPGADYALVNQRKFLIPLAEYFISQVEAIFNGCSPVIPLKMFIDWIGKYTPVAFYCEPYDGEQNGRCPGDETEAVSCASAFSNRLNDMDCQIFFFYHCQGLSHDEVKKQMKRKSFATYQKEQIKKKLSEFLMPFSWEHNSDASLLFLEKLCQILSQKIRNFTLKAV